MANPDNTALPTRVKVFDPNDFSNQNSTNLFGDKNYNMSVNPEDLCILVELTTSVKGRSVLVTSTTNGVKKDKGITVNFSDENVDFISGSNDASTGNRRFLTTNYTNITTSLNPITEALGITNIEIDFNSSYAPMVTINFVDIKGGSIFQSNGKSPYNVFFRLPYPLFKLKIKGYYGKPVEYCLHLTKCNTKFNSQNGNFEITAQFIGYTYALLSDMLIGYLKAAERTKRGQNLLATTYSGETSITDFLKITANIDAEIKKFLSVGNEDATNLTIVKELEETLTEIDNITTSTIDNLNNKDNTGSRYPVDSSTDSNIVIVKFPVESTDLGLPFSDYENWSGDTATVPIFQKKYNELVKQYNQKSGSNQEVKLVENLVPFQLRIQVKYLTDLTLNQELRILISYVYGINGNSTEATSIIDILKKASLKITETGESYIKFYDFTKITNSIKSAKVVLSNFDKTISKTLANSLKNRLTTVLKFEPNLRNMVKLFTTSIEILLIQLFEVSALYKNQERLTELQPWIDNLDVNTNQSNSSPNITTANKKDITIFPWPEYNVDNTEQYLGSTTGPLKTPRNVPEIDFTEELFYWMLINEQETENLKTEGQLSFYSVSPHDSLFYTKVNPYDRLVNQTPDDVARLISLRAIGFLRFSNYYLTKEEIESFAKAEGNQILTKFNDNKNIIKGLSQKYATPDLYITTAQGVINGKTVNVFSANSDTIKYTYIDETISNRYIVPLDKGFTDVTYSLANESAATYKLSSRMCDDIRFIANDTANYISFIEKNDYEAQTYASPTNTTTNTYKFTVLNSTLSKDSIKDAGFLANNGAYGVQEFKLINYDGSGNGVQNTIPFFSLFYDNGNSTVLSIGQKRTKPFLAEWDLLTADGKSENLFSPYPYKQKIDLYNKIVNNHENINKPLNSFDSISNTNAISYPFFNFATDWLTEINSINLFGSRFYNAQTTYGRGYLFLHCFPWRGLVNQTGKNIGIFARDKNNQAILNTFQIQNGFIQVPKLWPAFIGALLWRYEKGNQTTDDKPLNTKIKFNKNDISILGIDPIIYKFGSGETNDWLLPGYWGLDGPTNSMPKTYEYMKYGESNMPMGFKGSIVSFTTLEKTLLNLPWNVKQQFIDEFYQFIESDFVEVQNNFEIIPLIANRSDNTTDADWCNSWKKINDLTPPLVDSTYTNEKIPFSTLTNITKYLRLKDSVSADLDKKAFTDRYNIFAYHYNSDTNTKKKYYNFNNNYIIEYKENSTADNLLKKLFFSYKYIANESIIMWNAEILKDYGCSYPIQVSKAKEFDVYINALNSVLKVAIENEQKKKYEANNLEVIKLEVYRTLKKIYDKWIASTDSADKILFQCCTVDANGYIADRLNGDTAMKNYRKDTGTPKLIDSFRFITRAFEDIGDKFQINPSVISNMILESPDNSFYEVISRILTENHFDFIALPNYIDYNKDEEIESVFKQYPYYLSQKITTTGPTFVCVYIGQTSSKLDFGTEAEYENDSFDFTNPTTLPFDFKQNPLPHEDRGAAFIVRYGQQNQNIFKDISLDQAEFSETAESLKVTDAIANSLSKTNQNYIGQNLFNVYSARSYKTEVQMMGNAMIQPMMYFQLDNIPMFHGAYMITRVKHSIQPNTMSTSFTGVRIKVNATPIIDVATLYGALLDQYDLPKADRNLGTIPPVDNATGGSSRGTTGSFPPIVSTIIKNTGINGNIVKNKITRSPIQFPAGIKNNITDSIEILTEAVNPLKIMLSEWVNWMKANGYKGENGNYAYINSGYRTIEEQQQVRNKAIANKRPINTTAEPGSSRHGWGIAIDLQYFNKNGDKIINYVNNKPNVSVGFDFNKNQSIVWLLDNSYRFGWIIPQELRDSNGTEEFWHWEYHGTSAKCLLEKNTNIKGHIISVDKNYDASVTNPKNPDGTLAEYKDCNYITIKEADGVSLNTINTNGDTLLWMYLTWQQGVGGASQHYKVANGISSSYNIPVTNIQSNWPGNFIADNGVKKSDITSLYNSDPKKLANAFINVYSKFIAEKSTEVIKLIESNKKNRIQVPYLKYKDVFKKYENSNENIPWTHIATIGFIENALCPDTNPNGTYQGMFQMNKNFDEFKTILSDANKGSSGYLNFVEYNIDKVVEGFVPAIIKTMNSFKKNTGYTA